MKDETRLDSGEGDLQMFINKYWFKKWPSLSNVLKNTEVSSFEERSFKVFNLFSSHVFYQNLLSTPLSKSQFIIREPAFRSSLRNDHINPLAKSVLYIFFMKTFQV